jgi:hypothetical protein
MEKIIESEQGMIEYGKLLSSKYSKVLLYGDL